MTLGKYARIAKRSARRNPALKKAYYGFRGLRHRMRLKFYAARLGSASNSGLETTPDPANLIWIFCTARSGSTWLKSMLAELLSCKVWEEPKVSLLFGEFYERAQQGQLGSTNFVMGDPTREMWMGALRNFVLETARAAHPSVTSRQYLVVKEPDGAIGAPLLMEALPESRMILLVRDPRDIVASSFDAHRKGSWMYEGLDESRRTQKNSPQRDADAFVRQVSNKYLKHLGNAKRAYDAHHGPKVLVRYEDLRADTLGAMRELCSSLKLVTDEKQLARVVGKHAWENVPKEAKGVGKFYRKATPGGWKEDLTPRHARLVEEITKPLLTKFYSQ